VSFGGIQGIVDIIKVKVSEAFTLMAASIPQLVEKVKEFYTNLQPWIPLITQVAIAAASFITVIAIINSVKNAIMGARVAMLALNTAFLANPVGIVIAIIVGLVAALILAYEKVDWFKDMVSRAWDDIKSITEKVFPVIKDVITTVFGAIFKVITAILTDISDFIGEQWAKITAIWDEHGALIMAIVKMTFGVIWEYIKVHINMIKGLFQIVWPLITGIVKIAWELIKAYISTAMDVIMGVIDVIMKLIKGDWEGAWDSILGIVTTIGYNIKKFLSDIDLVTIGKDIIAGLIKGIGSMISGVGDAVKNIGNKVKDTFTNFFSIKSPSRLMMGLGINVGEGLEAGLDKMQKKVTKASEGLSIAANPIMAGFKNKLRGASVPTGNISPISSGGYGSGSVTNNNQRTNKPSITNYFTPAESTPSESARKQEQMLQRLAMEF
ncbi:MAG: hypothetical protein ABIR91_01740, partial [Candidatus Saccharimonadales bacterium]